MAVPATLVYLPAEHLACAAQESVLVLLLDSATLNNPAAQSLQFGCAVVPPDVSVDLPAGLHIHIHIRTNIHTYAYTHSYNTHNTYRHTTLTYLYTQYPPSGVLGTLVVRYGRFEEPGWACLTLDRGAGGHRLRLIACAAFSIG